ncbi:acetoacetate decarboxylase [Tabrizicola sp.]|uniref:acetoacetate decarboxylase n=1 Tax=Tabrizicola sp. TaxID=2005166 RepID=UPI0026237360|nr:acetoacetate decarboxylase [Tabrizicola sp.]MDM7931664.1 acetoacetate decarboxylase [Tabrizicola sp.]
MMKWPTTRADIIKPGFSTPLDAPMVPPFPFTFRNAEILTLTYRTDPAAIAALLPEPLVSTGDRVMIHVYKMNDTDWLGPYKEVNVMVGADLPGKATGAYSPWLFLSSDIGVAHGRELHGQPKKLGNPKLEFRADLIVGGLERNGIDVLTGTMPYKQTPAQITDLSAIFPFATNLNLKAIDHIDGTPAIRQLTSRQLADVQVTECWRGPCTVELRPNAQAPLHRLPVLEMLDGFYWKATFTLVPGVILHDYLTEV